MCRFAWLLVDTGEINPQTPSQYILCFAHAVGL